MSDRPTPETDAAWACFKGYMEPLQDVKDLSRKLERERNEAREELEEYRSIAENIGAKKAVSEKEKAIKERDEWKNKAYSHATDYTLMEAKCFRLEQQLKEYDKLKS